MNRKKQISNGWFHKIYVIYGSVFLLLCAVVVTSCYLDLYIKIVVPAALALLALLLIFFVLSIKKGVLAVFQECGKSLDAAIAGRLRKPLNEETELALFQTKLDRFVALKDKSFQDTKDQKEQIESLLADISHQTKTPIANILLYSQLLAEKSTENLELIHKLTAQSEKLRTLIQTLVEMSRLENGIIRCTPEEAQIHDFLLQIVGDFFDPAQAKEIRISLECEDGITAVFDRKWLREAIGNLVDNGIKYTQPGGEIRLQVLAYEMFVQINVADNGRGIREEELPKIFSRFYRSREVAACEGLGLGLYLAREMIVAQRGYIKAVSEPGKGSEFQVFIPKRMS